jgi:hypothetical protein
MPVELDDIALEDTDTVVPGRPVLAELISADDVSLLLAAPPAPDPLEKWKSG